MPSDLEADRVVVQQGGARNIRANYVEIHQSGAALIEADQVTMQQSGLVAALASQAKLQDCQVGAVIAQNVQADSTRSLFLAAGKVEGNVNTVISLPVALAAGALFGLIVGLIGLLKRNA